MYRQAIKAPLNLIVGFASEIKLWYFLNKYKTAKRQNIYLKFTTNDVYYLWLGTYSDVYKETTYMLKLK